MLRLETKRDRTILYLATTVAALLLFLLGLEPSFKNYRDISKNIEKKEAEIKSNKALIEQSKTTYKPRLDQWMKDGINRTGDVANSSTGALITNYSEELGLTFEQLNTMSSNIRSPKNRDFPQNIIRARGSGSYHRVLTFLWYLASDPNPLRVTEIDMVARDDNPQFLSFNMLVATTFYVPDTRQRSRTTAGPAVAGSN